MKSIKKMVRTTGWAHVFVWRVW